VKDNFLLLCACVFPRYFKNGIYSVQKYPENAAGGLNIYPRINQL
jgi:hypothetical protein